MKPSGPAGQAIALTAVAVLLIGAASTHAQAGPEQASTSAWADGAVQAQGWDELGFGDNSAHYARKVETGGPVAVIELRTEYRNAETREGKIARSSRVRMELRCAELEWRSSEVAIFASNNFSGVQGQGQGSDWAAIKPDDGSVEIVRYACGDEAAGRLAAAIGPDWSSGRIAKAGWDVVGQDQDSLMLGRRLTGASPRRVEMRVEFNEGLPNGDGPKVFTLVETIEADCAGARQRSLDGAVYTQNNMGGLRLSDALSPWEPVRPGSMAAIIQQYACADLPQ